MDLAIPGHSERMGVGQVVAAGLLCVALPAASWLDGSGGSMAWTMFSKSETYRLELSVVDRFGSARVVNPTALAPMASVDLATFLSGSETWRHGPVVRGLERSIGGLARLACHLPGEPKQVRLRLETRQDLDAPVHVTHAVRSCP